MRALGIAVVLSCVALEAHAADRTASVEMERAQACLDRRDYGCAVEHFDRARALSPQSSGPWLGLGLSYAAEGRCAEALPVLDEYLRRKPVAPNPNALSARGSCRQKLDDEARAAAAPPRAAEPAQPALVGGLGTPTPAAAIERPAPVLFTAAPPKPMARWKVGLIAGGVVLGVGIVVGGITAGVLAARGELHGEAAFTPVVLP